MSQGIMEVAKRLDMKHNVCIRVIDEPSGKVVSEHIGHNAATNSMLTGIAHYIAGEGLNNNSALLDTWIPQYISLGTMGLYSQDEDDEGLPAGIGTDSTRSEEDNFIDYLLQTPGYGSDGYDTSKMNNRKYAGLGPVFASREDTTKTCNCELISGSYPRAKISFRQVLPETESEYPETIDVVLSAMISTGALAQFRESDKDYVFISEVGLWSTSSYSISGQNGLLAGYRIAPPDRENWDMSKETNRRILKQNIIRIGVNQVAQIIWKIQLGGLSQLGGLDALYPQEGYISWKVII